MIFPYWEEIREGQPRLLPVIPVTLEHDGKTADAYALVDSGAEHSVFPVEAAEDVGFDLANQSSVTIVGAGGKETPGKAAVAHFQMGPYRWTGPVIFSAAVNERPLLGQAGFFAFFTVTFRHARRDIEIRQSQSPRWRSWR